MVALKSDNPILPFTKRFRNLAIARSLTKFILFFLAALFFSKGWAYVRYGEMLCKEPGYSCLKINRGDSWSKLFPDVAKRDLVKRINRMNIFLQPEMIIAVPNQLEHLNVIDVAPFSKTLKTNEKVIYVDEQKMAWAAYDETGLLLRWGPISSGSPICPNIPGGCITPGGSFRVTKKQGANCISKTFPKRIDGGRGGAEMPYCVYFFKGYALHGGSELPGYNASHGCVRLNQEDVQWLNEKFVEVPGKGVRGTRIIIVNAPIDLE